MTVGQAVLEVTDATFATAVIEQSRTRPVVVDFWAPWCGPCRMLGPIIEQVAQEFGGEIPLAKLNVDENPQTAMQYRVQGIPAVKAFRDGRVVNEFTGVMPDARVRQFFQSLAPSPTDLALQAAASALRVGNVAAAEANYRKVLETERDNPQAVVGLGELLVRRGDYTEADTLLKALPADRRAKALRHRIFLKQYAERHANEDLRGEAQTNPHDARARYRWGVMLAAQEDYIEALDELLASVAANRNYEDGAARKAMLAIFEILGLDSMITREYQRKLENVLF
jgi:putative thioredoxin